MEYKEILEEARKHTAPHCMACPVCNGKACGNNVPGPGSKAPGNAAARNYDKWQEVRVNMDTLCGNKDVDTSFELFGRTFKYPFFVAPVGAVFLHYSDKYDDLKYFETVVKGAADAGIAAFTGDGQNPIVMEGACKVIGQTGGLAVPTLKPWGLSVIEEKMAMIKAADPFAVAMDIDAAGLPFLKGQQPPAGGKTVEELKNIANAAGRPFILKGIMTSKAAIKAQEAGAAAIVVSNHGGRVLDQCPATAEVLPEIVRTLRSIGSEMKIFVDGGIRSGTDIFKAFAMGADGVLIARPYVTAVYGGGEEGIRVFTEKFGEELADTMSMCGAFSLSEITEDMIRCPF
jgi:methylmalonyl-CoA mutase cobalamin-binding subunit